MSATPPPAYGAPSAPLAPADEKTWAIVTHVTGVFFSFVPALIVFLVFKGRGPFLEAHAKTALNFQLTLLLAYFAAGILTLIGIGFLLLAALPVVALVFAIIAAVKASSGEYYVYPATIPFLR